MKIAFTICSNNYLSFARVLGRSFIQHNPEYRFYIGLADEFSSSIEKYYDGFEIIPCVKIGLEELYEMARKYTVVELNTAVKPFYFIYFHNKFPEVKQILFLDPDMFVYQSLADLDAIHLSADIILTPHILYPMPLDGKNPSEISYLSTGIFNLGFLSLKLTQNTLQFLEWWKDRLKVFCYVDFRKGLFVDQKWINLVPVFFNSVFILRHPGYNVSYWNIHERFISIQNGELKVNKDFPLVIYHFSSVNILQGKLFFKYQDRFDDKQFPEAVKLFLEYKEKIFTEGYNLTSKSNCYYAGMHEDYKKQQLKKGMSGKIKLFVKSITPGWVRENVKHQLSKLLE